MLSVLWCALVGDSGRGIDLGRVGVFARPKGISLTVCRIGGSFFTIVKRKLETICSFSQCKIPLRVQSAFTGSWWLFREGDLTPRKVNRCWSITRVSKSLRLRFVSFAPKEKGWSVFRLVCTLHFVVHGLH